MMAVGVYIVGKRVVGVQYETEWRMLRTVEAVTAVFVESMEGYWTTGVSKIVLR